MAFWLAVPGSGTIAGAQQSRQKWALPSIEIRVDRARRSRRAASSRAITVTLRRRPRRAHPAPSDRPIAYGACSSAAANPSAGRSATVSRRRSASVRVGISRSIAVRQRSIAAVWALRRNVTRSSSRSLLRLVAEGADVARRPRPVRVDQVASRGGRRARTTTVASRTTAPDGILGVRRHQVGEVRRAERGGQPQVDLRPCRRPPSPNARSRDP